MFRYGNRRALEEAADEHSGPRGEGSGDGGAAGSGAGEGFGEVKGAMVGINSVHVALSSVSAIQVHDRLCTRCPMGREPCRRACSYTDRDTRGKIVLRFARGVAAATRPG